MKKQERIPRLVDEYIEEFPEDVQAVLRKIRATVFKVAPGAAEKISYRMPAYSLNGRWIYFAAFKSHVGFYPGPDVITAFKKELAPYEQAKGTVRFPLAGPMPLALISRMVVHRFKGGADRPKNTKTGAKIS
jgi:uncharacterized protein YdhG (YjbR/CyaY superfamily)